MQGVQAELLAEVLARITRSAVLALAVLHLHGRTAKAWREVGQRVVDTVVVTVANDRHDAEHVIDLGADDTGDIVHGRILTPQPDGAEIAGQTHVGLPAEGPPPLPQFTGGDVQPGLELEHRLEPATQILTATQPPAGALLLARHHSGGGGGTLDPLDSGIGHAVERDGRLGIHGTGCNSQRRQDEIRLH